MAVALLFAAIGIYTRRPFIASISLGLFALGIWAKKSSNKFNNPEKVFWNEFIKKNPLFKRRTHISWYYGKNELESIDWIKNVRKRIITGVSYFEPAFPYESNPKPRVGDCSIIKDWRNNPQCIIETIGVETVAFKDVTNQHISLEGCESLAEWKQLHKEEYQEICKNINLVFSEEHPVLFECFQLIYDKES